MSKTTPLAIQAQTPKIVFSEKQKRFLAESNKSVNICEGSIRAGKTLICLWRWFFFVAKAPKTGTLIMCGRTIESVWENMLDPMMNEEIFGSLAKQVVGNRLSNTVIILGRRVRVMGGSKVDSEASLRGATVCGAMVDEITTLHETFFTQLLGRMSVEGAQLFGTTNPDSPAHWFKKKFLDRVGAAKNGLVGWTRWFFEMDDNPSLSAGYKRRKRAEFTGLFFKRFILGHWVAAEGAIFDFWVEEDFVIAWDDLPEMVRLYGVGIDYGTTHATSAIILGLGKDNKLYYVDEWRYEADDKSYRLNDEKLASQIKAWLAEPHVPHGKGHDLEPEWVIVDPAAASFKVMLEDKGIDDLLNADNDVLYGIRTMSSMFTRGLLKVSDRCQGFITEIPGYAWDPKAAEKGEDKPIKVADDSIDPARYVLITTETEWRDDLGLAA